MDKIIKDFANDLGISRQYMSRKNSILPTTNKIINQKLELKN